MRFERLERYQHLLLLEAQQQVNQEFMRVDPDYLRKCEALFRQNMTASDRRIERLTRQLEIALEIGREAAYKRRISLRTRKALAKARREGKRLGRPPGTKIDLKKLKRLRARGLTQTQIAEKLGATQSLVSRALAKLNKGKRK